MKSTFLCTAVMVATSFILDTISALPASPIAISPESYSLSDHLPSLNVSFAANATDANDILIEECGDERRNVQRAYNLARAATMVALADVARGVQSPYGFNAMFKVDESKYQVSHYLYMIYHSQGLRDLKPNVGRVTPPRFACAQQNSSVIYAGLQLKFDPWERCRHPTVRQSSHRVYYASGTAYIFLCPRFHTYPPAPAGNHCPTVRDNRFVGDSDVFYRNYQMYTLMHELIRFYLQNYALGLRSELRDWNRCVGLDVEDSLRNPSNFLLYIALAQQLCLEAPDPFQPPFGSLSRGTRPSVVNMTMAASAQLASSNTQMAIASAGPAISLILPSPESETS